MTIQTVPRISVAALKDKLDAGTSLLLVDVRGTASFAARRIRGAVSMPKQDPTTNWEALPRDTAIVLY
ncbi:MAG TPA: rhodanese-like domain-containing protein [Candidatus Binatia bacterium]|jgi:rhodanese-related sulfurtransferase|nr:rhodanese-like domain-containing protein [Candidatus Binatia bacterium]